MVGPNGRLRSEEIAGPRGERLSCGRAIESAMALLKWTLIVLLVGYVGAVAVLYVVQRALMYFPDTERTPPAAAGLPAAQEILLDSADGERLIAWHVPPRGDRPVVLYLHGNGGALSHRAERFRALTI